MIGLPRHWTAPLLEFLRKHRKILGTVILWSAVIFIGCNLGARLIVWQMAPVFSVLENWLEQQQSELKVSINTVNSDALLAYPRIHLSDLELINVPSDKSDLARLLDLNPEVMTDEMPSEEALQNQAIVIGDMSLGISLIRSLLSFTPSLNHLHINNCELPVRENARDWSIAGLSLTGRNSSSRSDQKLLLNVDNIRITDCVININRLDQSTLALTVHSASIKRSFFKWQFQVRASIKPQDSIWAYGTVALNRRGEIRVAEIYAESGQALLALLVDQFLPKNFLPIDMSGARMRLWINRKNDSPYEAEIRLDADELNLTNPQLELSTPHLALAVNWEAGEDFTAILSDLSFVLLEQPLDFQAALKRYRGTVIIYVDELPADNFEKLIQQIDWIAPELREIAGTLAPTGKLKELLITLPHYTVSTEWGINSKVENLVLQSSGYIPGIDRVDGSLVADPAGGILKVTGTNAEVVVEELYSAKSFREVDVEMRWILRPQEAEIDIPRLFLRNVDDSRIQGGLNLVIPVADLAPQLNLTLEGLDFDVPTALSFVPEKFRSSLPDWLFTHSSLGQVERAVLNLNGELYENVPADEWPLEFKLETSFTSARLDIPMGLVLENIGGFLTFHNSNAYGKFAYAATLGTLPWGSGSAEFTMDFHTWVLAIDGTHLDGTINYDNRKPEMEVYIKELDLPDVFRLEFPDSTGTTSLDPVLVAIDKIMIEKVAWGHAVFRVSGEGDTVIVNDLYWEDPEIRWAIKDSTMTWSGSGATEQTDVQANLFFCDFPDILSARTCNSKNFKHNGQVSVDLRWPGGPSDFTTTNTSGIISAKLTDGKFLKADRPDILRVFEFFNFDTMVRRLGLNISAVGSEGLEYFELEGRAKLDKGQLELPSPGVFMSGVSGRFLMTGKVDIDNSLVDGKLLAILPLRENLGWLGWTLGASPPAVVGAWLINKIFGKQLDNMFSKEFTVTGSFDDIQIQPAEN